MSPEIGDQAPRTIGTPSPQGKGNCVRGPGGRLTSPPHPSWLFLVKSAEAPLLGEGCEAHLGRVSGSHLAV